MSSAGFFSNYTFPVLISFRNTNSVKFPNKIMLDILLGMIWVQPVCKDHQQMILAGKKNLTKSFLAFSVMVKICLDLDEARHLLLQPNKNIGTYISTFCPLGNFSCFFDVCWFFSNQFFSKNSFRNIIRVSTRLDPDQAWHFVRPDLGPSCLQRVWADDTSR